ncbi:hypothetical protein CEXT_344161 [Caerostris extrusa]|uniref:Uncharacterized protein n=1 Tax=Caerostris extrusa TaxID=172846 RepID=A0AAV4XWR7_CAEEX|nr:hypothetical protein CEXT_344161 [Caerostris extrusa]
MVLLRAIWKYPSPPAVESNVKNTEKVSPEEMCRQLCTAFKEMEKRKFLDEWVSRYHCPIESCKLHNSSKNLVNNVNCNVNNVVNCIPSKNINASISSNVKPAVNSKNVTLANASNSGKVNGNLKSKTKRNASQISPNVNDSGEFRTPNKKLIAKANFTFNKESVSDDLVTKNHFQALSTDAAAEDEGVTVNAEDEALHVMHLQALYSFHPTQKAIGGLIHTFGERKFSSILPLSKKQP